jgi:hypothetical protein
MYTRNDAISGRVLGPLSTSRCHHGWYNAALLFERREEKKVPFDRAAAQRAALIRKIREKSSGERWRHSCATAVVLIVPLLDSAAKNSLVEQQPEAYVAGN